METQVHILLVLLILLPAVPAGLAWGRRGVLAVAVPAAGLLLALRLLGWSPAAGTAAGFVGDLAAAALCAAAGLVAAGHRERCAAHRRALQQTEDKHRLLLEEIVTGIVILREKRILLANRRFADLVGLSAEELPGRDFLPLIHPEDRRRAEELLASPDGVARSPDWEGRLIRNSGRSIWVQLSACPSSHEGLPAVLLNVWDITCQKLAEEQRSQLSDLARRQEEQLVHSTRLAELGEMAAAISHEINQPLTGIRNYARNAFYMLDKGMGSMEEVKHNLRLISDQVDRASRIINQMRELARRSERSFTALDANGIIRESVEFLMAQMRMSAVEVRLELGQNLPPVMGDRVRLGQVFLNLLTNARQAMEEMPERRLVVRTYVEAGGSRSVIAEVADTGKGFSAEEARKLFVPFFTTKKSGQGTGLGLSISQSIIKDHQGVIEAYGAPGAGATFRVRLPAAGV